MSASNGPILPSEIHSPSRGPLRLRMAEHPGRDQLDGGWWPHSRDPAVELADLVDQVPTRSGRIVRASISPLDWEPAPRRIAVVGGFVNIGSLPGDDRHLVRLETADRTVLHVLVVPPGFTDAQGAEALLAAATSGNAHSASDLLREVTELPDVDPSDLWSDDGKSWWEPHAVAPSFRTGR